jgi:hypothetical protein
VTKNSIDIVITSVPYTDTLAPIMAPAMLKGQVIEAGYSCVAFDGNAYAVSYMNSNQEKLYSLKNFFFFEKANGIEDDVFLIIDSLAEKLLDYNPKIIALSLLHYQCQIATKWLCFRLKKLRPDIKIVIGGTGIIDTFVSNDYTYCNTLKDLGLIDFFISGDGEVSLIEFLKNNLSYDGINNPNWNELTDINNLAYPNYDDYDFSYYESPFIGLLGSRGCVRQCTFCDIHHHWKRYIWRSGENIFNEMLYQNKKHGSRWFKFQDSLINGNVKEYTKLVTLIAEHNEKNPDNSLHWASFFILRSKEQMPEEVWALTAKGGGWLLEIGIESLIDKNRHHMKKKFSNEDIEFGLEMAKKYNIKLAFLIMVGYVTETEQDHIETLEWVRRNKHYANDPISAVSISGTVSILPNTWLETNQKNLQIEWAQGEISAMYGNNHLWEIKSTNNTYENRLRRLAELASCLKENNFVVKIATIDPHIELENLISKRMKNYAHSITRNI